MFDRRKQLQVDGIDRVVNRGQITEAELLILAQQRYVDAFCSSFFESHGLVIQDGLFQGMDYISEALGSAHLPKILGTYENELSEVLRQEFARTDSFLQIGCAEGYYTVGAARCHQVRVSVGVDIDHRAAISVAKLAAKNGVREEVFFRKTIEEAVELLSGATFVMVDVEGAEVQTLDQLFKLKRTGNFANTGMRLLVETDFEYDEEFRDRLGANSNAIINKCQDNGGKLEGRFAQDPSIKFTPLTADLSMLRRAALVYEGRHPNQEWLLFRFD